MVANSRNSSSSRSGSELLAIKGIGPGVAQRLTAMGRGALEALASASAAEIVAAAADWPFRPSSRRVQEWIDEARKLLGASGLDAPRAPRPGLAPRATPSPSRVRHTFTLEVQTNDSGSGTAVATKIVDVGSQAFDTWSGWDARRLVRFVERRSGIDGPAHRIEEEVVHGYGVLDGRVTVSGGRAVRAILRLGGHDTGAEPASRAAEWELSLDPAERGTSCRFPRQRLDLAPGEPAIGAVDLVVPSRCRDTRVLAVVRILGPGEQTRLVHRLSDSTLELVVLP